MQASTVSIITVCFNAEKHLEETIRSVLGQQYPHIEYIIIDGASRDGTLDIIHKYGDRISKVVSEPDAGLYDAMNKGLRHATGDYVFFLNADDALYAPDTLEKMLEQCTDADAIYGEALFVNEQGAPLGLRSAQTPHKTPAQLNWKSFRHGMNVSHQAFLLRRSLAEDYDLRYSVCADIDWMIRCLKNCHTVCNSGRIVSKFRIGGSSTQSRRTGWKERFLILKKHYGAAPNVFNHGLIAFRYLFSKK